VTLSSDIKRCLAGKINPRNQVRSRELRARGRLNLARTLDRSHPSVYPWDRLIRRTGQRAITSRAHGQTDRQTDRQTDGHARARARQFTRSGRVVGRLALYQLSLL